MTAKLKRRFRERRMIGGITSNRNGTLAEGKSGGGLEDPVNSGKRDLNYNNNSRNISYSKEQSGSMFSKESLESLIEELFLKGWPPKKIYLYLRENEIFDEKGKKVHQNRVNGLFFKYKLKYGRLNPRYDMEYLPDRSIQPIYSQKNLNPIELKPIIIDGVVYYPLPPQYNTQPQQIQIELNPICKEKEGGKQLPWEENPELKELMTPGLIKYYNLYHKLKSEGDNNGAVVCLYLFTIGLKTSIDNRNKYRYRRSNTELNERLLDILEKAVLSNKF